MSSSLVLRMKYHPAKKEVRFKYFQYGEEQDIGENSSLIKYQNMHGKFILQNYGEKFLNDIVRVFSGTKDNRVEVITTKLDYEDFTQMVEEYNSRGETKLNVNLLAELPNMEETFDKVMNYGKESIDILKKNKEIILNGNYKEDSVKECANNYSRIIEKNIENINDKITNLSDDKVNICFVGAYSSGKSALINSLLGYKILPEDPQSKTAKIYIIENPDEKENYKIIFNIGGVQAVLEWNKRKKEFEFTQAPNENDIRTKIQERINGLDKSMQMHEQMYEILDYINTFEMDIQTEIYIKFDIPFDTEKVKFRVYDTPGTDSNFAFHQEVLYRALENQMQSILVFVIKPDCSEGTGNNVLLKEIYDAQFNKNNKVSIDINRSMFVITKGDTINRDERKSLKNIVIKSKAIENVSEDNPFDIDLTDKKVFFTSAKYGYAAKAKINGISTAKEEGTFKGGFGLMCDEEVPESLCYKENHCASSELSTNRLIKMCDDALNDAKSKEDKSLEMLIASGIYALEEEIKLYGSKFASAVKAYSIIDSVDRTLNNMTEQTELIQNNNDEEIKKTEKNIKTLKTTISEGINKEYDECRIKGGKIPSETLMVLNLDSDSLADSFVGGTKKEVLDSIRKAIHLFGWDIAGDYVVSEKNKQTIINMINNSINNFTYSYVDNRRKLLEKKRDEFTDTIKEIIKNNGDLSESAKSYFLSEIPKVEIKQPKITDIDDIWKLKERKILIFKPKYIDKASFEMDLTNVLRTTAEDMADQYKKDYARTLNGIIDVIKNNFESNISTYSLNIKALQDNHEAMLELAKQIRTIVDALTESKKNLEKIIWEEK